MNISTGLTDFYGNDIKVGDIVEFHNDKEKLEGTVLFFNNDFYVSRKNNSIIGGNLESICTMFVPIIKDDKEIDNINKKLKDLDSIIVENRVKYQEIYKRKVALVQEQNKKNIGQCFKNSNSTYYYIVLDSPQWEYRARDFNDSFNENEYKCLCIVLPYYDSNNIIPEISLDKVNLYGINRNDKYFGCGGQYEKITREEFDSVLENNLGDIKKFVQKSINKNK